MFWFLQLEKTSNTSTIRNEAGFTMIDVLISVVVLSVGILGLLSSVHTVSHFQRHSRDMTSATMHAANKLEEIKRVATDEPGGGSAFGFGYFVDDGATGFLNGYGSPDNWTRTSSDTIDGITRDWTIQIFPVMQDADESFLNSAFIRMVEVVVDASWTNEKGETETVQLATVLHRRQFVGDN